MKLYSTVRKEANISQTIEKSKFIAHVKPVTSKEEADSFIAEIKKKYRDATHNVPAMVIGEKMEIQWGSDDGEPQGTSGAPIVQMLVSMGLTNLCIVVTRYFGGIKLGPGGLVRAYTSSAKLALDESGITDVVEKSLLTFLIDYTFLPKLQKMEGENLKIVDTKFSDKVEISLYTNPESYATIIDAVDNMTNGKAILKGNSIVKISL